MKTHAMMIGMLVCLTAGASGQQSLPQGAAVPLNPTVLELSELPAQFSKAFGPDVAEVAQVAPDLNTIDAMGIAMPFTIEVFNGRQLEVMLVSRTRTKTGYTGHGELLDYTDGQFVMARVGEHMAMAIRIPSENLFIMIRSIGGGMHIMQRIDESELPGCEAGLEPDGIDADHDHAHGEFETHEHASHGSTEPGDGGLGLRSCVQPDPTWDIMIVYTPSARAAAAIADGASSTDKGPIEALFRLYIEEANLTYDNSLVQARLRLVHMYEQPYANGTSLGDALDDVTDGTGGLSGVAAERDAYYADAVMLMVDDGPGGCGLAWCCSSSGFAYGVSRWDCWGVTFVHELGHNLGCAHNPEDVDCNGCSNTSRGHYFTGSDQNQYGTIMSYIGANFWYHSNPSVSFQGQTTGLSGQRDNVATINSRRFTFNDFRTSHFEVWVDLDMVGIGAGSFGNPYSLIDFGQLYLLENDKASEMPTMYIKASSADQTPTFVRPMTVRACGGTVTIGRN